MEDDHASVAINLENYKHQAEQIERQRDLRDYPRVAIHDVNNSLAKINNALWLMAQEGNPSTPLFRTCQDIVERELKAASKRLGLEMREDISSPA